MTKKKKDNKQVFLFIILYAMNEEEFNKIDRFLFIECQKLWMDASVQLDLVDFMMIKRLHEMEENGVPLREFAKVICNRCRHRGWVHCIMKYLFCNDYQMPLLSVKN